ncbi:MAG TPA: lytic murein transglycosylase, partial [Cellvibrio sp.]
MNSLRHLIALACCTGLLSCAQAPASKNVVNQSASVSAVTPPSVVAQPSPKPIEIAINEADFAVCIDRFTQLANTQGISTKVINSSLAKAALNKRVLELDKQQPEFTTTFADYFNRRVTAQRVAQGRSLWIKHRTLLDRVEQQYGVPAPYLLAFWGLETNFGNYFGNTKVIDSLATLACDTRRSEFFTIELMNA